MITEEFINNHTLQECLEAFSGAPKDGQHTLEEQFALLARKFLYGGYIRVRDEYAIFISKVEFYYHEEKEVPGDRITDDIVYHRDGRFLNRKVPYFPIMTLHSHWSGFDIAFESETGHYRASALIRKYVVIDLNPAHKGKRFIELKTSWESAEASADKDNFRPVGEVIYHDVPAVDDRSTYLQYYLNGFSMNGEDSRIEWRDIDNAEYPDIKNEARKNAPGHKWGFTFTNIKEYKDAILRTNID